MASEPATARKSTRLKSRSYVPNNDEDSPPVIPPPKKTDVLGGMSPGAIRSRRYREKLKGDPERYEAYKALDRLQSKLRRQSMTAEQKTACSKGGVERTRKCREKKKEQGLPLNRQKPKPTTRAAILQNREKERVRKASYRLALNPYQKVWINRKRREDQAKKKRDKVTASQNQELKTDLPDDSIGYKKQTTKQKAIAKALKSLPKSPRKFADVVDGLTNTKSPRKRKFLQKKGLQSPAARKSIDLSNNIAAAVEDDLKTTSKERSNKSNARRRVLCGIFARYAKFRGCASILNPVGTTKKYLDKCSSELGSEYSRKKRKDAVPEKTVDRIEQFFERVDISRDDPSQTSVSARTGKPKRFMEKTLKEAHSQYVSEVCEEEKVSFTTFVRLKPATIKATQHNKLKTCKCEYCVKVQLRLDAINSFLAKKNHRELTLTNRMTALDMTMCPEVDNFHDIDCVERKCAHCGVNALHQHLQPVLENHADEMTDWNVWTLTSEEYRQSDGSLKTVTKWKPVKKMGPFDQLVSEMEEEMASYSLHMHNADWQYRQFANLREDLPDKWLLTVSDFGQNYTCHHQDEIQGAHWSRSESTIHPVVAYYHTDAGITRESFMFLSNDHKHDAHASHFYQMKAIEDLFRRGMQFERIVHFSDGCASQYKGKTNFVDVSFAEEDTGVVTEKHYFGSRHGKGPCDAEIGVLKKNACLAVKRRAAIISDTRSLFDWAQKKLSGEIAPTRTRTTPSWRQIVFVGQGEINRDRPERTGSDIRTLAGTRSLHAIRSQAPYTITWRKRSCFCDACKSSDGGRQCINAKTCGPWTVFDMRKRRRGNAAAVQSAPAPPVPMVQAAPALPIPSVQVAPAPPIPTVQAAPAPPVTTVQAAPAPPMTTVQAAPAPAPPMTTVQASGSKSPGIAVDQHQVNSCVIVRYPDRCYPGIVSEVHEHFWKVKFLKPHGRKKNFFVYPEGKDEQTVSRDMIVCAAHLIPASSTLREWVVEGYDF